MGLFEARGTELWQAIDKPATTPAPPEAEIIALRSAVALWDADRRDHLKALTDILLQRDRAATASAWRSRAERLLAEVQTFSDALRNITSPSEWARQFVQMNANADRAFAEAVVRAGVVAETRDYLVDHLAILDQHKNDLETKWQRLLGEHRSFEEQEKTVANEVDELQRKAAYEAKSFISKLTHEAADLVLWVNKYPDQANVPIPGKTYREIIVQWIQYWRNTRATFEADVIRLLQHFRQETSSVLLLFGEFRADTKQFIDKYGYRVAQERFDGARGALADLVSSGGTSSGNRSDAEQFAESARILLTGHLNNVKNSWDAFVEKHERKFFGPVGPDISKALLDREFFGDKCRNLTANSLLELLERWRNDARSTIDVALSGIDGASKDLLRRTLSEDLRELEAAGAERPAGDLDALRQALEEAQRKIDG